MGLYFLPLDIKHKRVGDSSQKVRIKDYLQILRSNIVNWTKIGLLSIIVLLTGT